MNLAFMSWVCPEWDLPRIADFAERGPYDGVEFRVNAGHAHEISTDTPVSRRRQIAEDFSSRGIEIPALATGHRLAVDDPEQVEGARANVDLAGDLGANYLRVFAGGDHESLTDELARETADALTTVAQYGENRDVVPVLETMHDIVQSPGDAYRILDRVDSDNVGLLWNRPRIDDADYRRIQEDVRHVHLHDEVLDPDFAGIEEMMRTFRAGGYTGTFSLEIIREDPLVAQELRAVGDGLREYLDA